MYARDDASRCVVLGTPNGARLHVEVAARRRARAAGLASRDAVGSDGSLLVWREAGRHPIWMANMRFDVDLLWLNAEDVVIAAMFAAPHCQALTVEGCALYEPIGSGTARAVLERPVGRARATGLATGVRVTRPRPASAHCAATPLG